MVHRYHRLYAARMQVAQHLAVTIDGGMVKVARLRLDTAPFDAQAGAY